MTLFEHLQNITYDKKPWNKLTEEDKKTANMFMINRFVSMEYNYIEIVNEFQTLNLPPQHLYNLYVAVLPKQNKFFKYVKKTIKETKGDSIKLLAKIFEVSERDAKDYINKLDKKQLELIHLQVEGIKTKKK